MTTTLNLNEDDAQLVTMILEEYTLGIPERYGKTKNPTHKQRLADADRRLHSILRAFKENSSVATYGS